MSYNYENKVALITGAASGIFDLLLIYMSYFEPSFLGFGKRIAERLTAKGCKVILSDINESAGIALEKQLNQSHGPEISYFIQCDVSDSKELKSLFEKSIERYKRLDVSRLKFVFL